MNIKLEYNPSERPNANDVMSDAMGYLFDRFIKSEQDNLNKDDLHYISIIGIMFKEMAEKAEAYYQLQEKGYEKNPHSLN